MGFSGIIYAAGASFLGAIFLFHALRVYVRGGEAESMQMFKYSILYLFVLFSLLLVDNIFLEI